MREQRPSAAFLGDVREQRPSVSPKAGAKLLQFSEMSKSLHEISSRAHQNLPIEGAEKRCLFGLPPDTLCRLFMPKGKEISTKMHFFTQNPCIYQFFVVSLYRVLKYEAPERQPTVRCSDEHPMTDYEIWDTGHPKTKNSPINN